MKAIIPGANVKIFGRAVHSLSKIGEELYLEPLDHGLSLRTVNSSRSAYACFLFAPAFFLHYDGAPVTHDTTNNDGDDEDALRCKIGMKSCLNIFKSLSTLEKTVDKCKITINMKEARLVFQLYCRHGIVKTHNLAFIESETLQAVFSKDLTPNILTAQSRLLADTVVNFQSNQEEISLIINPEEVIVKNYVDDQPDSTKAIRTQMRLSPDEFESFQVGVDTEVTFCLKELRAILSFSEPANLPISIHFESPGKPIVFCLDSDPSFEANFVLATLADLSTQVSCSQHSTQLGKSTQSKFTYKNRTTTPHSVRTPQPVQRKRRSSDEHQPSTSKRHEMEPAGNGPSSVLINGQSDAESRVAGTGSKGTDKMQAVLDDLMNDDFNDVTMMNTNAASEDAEDDSPVIPLQSEKSISHPVEQSGYLETDDVAMENNEEEDDDVPGTPPKSTQFKSLFFGLSQVSQTASQQQRASNSIQKPFILAEDTDDDD